MLALQGGWCSMERLNSHVSHSSHVSPISYTHQERRRDGPMERKRGESEREKRGEGEESEEFDMLCAWVTCIKQRKGI